MSLSLPDTLRQLAPLLQSGHGRVRIKRGGHTPGLGPTETLYVVVDGLERRVSLMKPEKYWLAESTPNHYVSTQLCTIRSALEEEILARGWRVVLYQATEGCYAQIYRDTPSDIARADCLTHALAQALLQALGQEQITRPPNPLDSQLRLLVPYARRLGLEAFIDPLPDSDQIRLTSPLDPDFSLSLEDLSSAGAFYRDAFLLAAQRATPPETCINRWGKRAEVLYRGEGTTGNRTVLARIYDQGEPTSNQLWSGSEDVFNQSWQQEIK